RRSGTQDGVRGRVSAQKLVAQLSIDDSIDLSSVLAGSVDWVDAPELIPALRRQTSDPATMALMLVGVLVRGKPNGRLRRKLEDALALLVDDDVALSLFCLLESGSSTPALHQQLRGLYHVASASRQKLSQWLDVLGEKPDRQRKLRTMLRVLAYELALSGQPIVGSHLASVIADLKQLLRLLGLEEYCDQVATSLALPSLTGEILLHIVVALVEQIWVSPDMVSEVLPLGELDQNYRLVHALGKLVQL
ncbi:HrpJ domain-containing protein, partial [Paraburkholderia sp. RL17-373-BIF-A]|uniref:HrpJ domain-containing protein n=1 Tax=Paraburkholderia sp. RL17-373-BIF-A TaxID=3031629 RepID=UPI0038B77094